MGNKKSPILLTGQGVIAGDITKVDARTDFSNIKKDLKKKVS